MGELVRLESRRRNKAADMAFAAWPKRLGCRPGPETTLGDLPDEVLSHLAELSAEASQALYDLVLGSRGWGAGDQFATLEAGCKVEALDSYLFLADQVRFELMRRLGWVEPTPAQAEPLITLSLEYKRFQGGNSTGVPVLRGSYPRYSEVQRRLAVEPEAVVRSLIPEALTVFRRRIPTGG